MADSTTWMLLAAAVITTGAIYMFNSDAKPTTHSQPKFTQMNQPGFKPSPKWLLDYYAQSKLPVEQRIETAEQRAVIARIGQVSDKSLPVARMQLATGKSFTGW